MKKLILMVGLVVVAFACGTGADMMGEIMDSGVPDAGAQPGTGDGMQFVGVSTEAVPATGGIFPMYAACNATFGSDHRMCTLAEILNTPKPPTLLEGQSWYQQDLNSTPCNGYSYAGTNTNPLNAPSVNEVGKVYSSRCSNNFTIACCGPK